MKEYVQARATSCLAEEVCEEEIPDWREDEPAQLNVGAHLSERELAATLEEFSSSLKGKSGQTREAEHRIDLSLPRPICLPPYRIPHAYREAVGKELQEMEENSIPCYAVWTKQGSSNIPEDDGWGLEAYTAVYLDDIVRHGKITLSTFKRY